MFFWLFCDVFGSTGIIKKSKLLGVLCLLGEKSLEIYLLHVYFTSGVRMMIRAFEINNAILAFVMAVCVGIVGPLLVSIYGHYFSILYL